MNDAVGRAGHGPDWDQAGGHPRGEEHDLQVAREAALHQAQDGRGDRTGDDGADIQTVILCFGSFAVNSFRHAGPLFFWQWPDPHFFVAELIILERYFDIRVVYSIFA